MFETCPKQMDAGTSLQTGKHSIAIVNSIAAGETHVALVLGVNCPI